MVLDYVAGPQCGGYATAPFGFRLWESGGFHDYCSNESLLCPECGAQVQSLHIQRVTSAYSEERYWMTVSSIPVGMGNPESLCLSFWRTEKAFSKEGTYRFYTVPWEAYVFDAWDRVIRLSHWQNGMYAGQRYYLTGWRQKFREQEKLRKLFEERYEHCRRFEFEADGLTVIAQRCEGDLIAEGKILHHCVASYAERHAKGLVTVLFVRRIEAPEVPYYTLSFYEADGHLCMNHGLRNCDETKEMKAFREKWEKWRDAGCKREERKTA